MGFSSFYDLFIRFTTTLIIISFSSGLFSAINKVKATNAFSLILLVPSGKFRLLFFSKCQMNSHAAILLFPLEN
ncbi:hypothetical protein EL17_21715 [Anditalea andensis]|uniref:Uncharacterized protein n=1 Tax=Anditalea andensis TaxID=1048983 RepID=A0A074LDD6_9BACT|nr:hypothetical protein EL17_21715 [Anditalea andensis]